ncbi:phage major capsid protein [Aquimarina sp. Aq78]|uniref:phage major capsid protein n=1 Tax=Aquimarina sp. Aq78 TaxID=1191889 RepID=UPI000D1058D6|nr:phage major capsid protein [Aquimarina sp. Aq78]
MKKSDALKQKRASKIKKWGELVNLCETEKREFTEDEQTQIDTLRSEIDALDDKITETEDFEKRETQLASSVGGESVTDGDDEEKQKVQKRFSITRMLRNALEGEEQDGAEKEAQEIAEKENREAGVSFGTSKKARVMIPLSFIRASQQTVSQDAGEYGGELVQNQAPRVIDGLEPKLWIQEMGATVLTGLSGGDIPMPVAGNYTFEWLAEGANITQQKNKYQGPVLNPKRAGASVSMSNRLLMQSSVDVDSLVRRKLSRGWENTINVAAINGAGGVAPTGVLNYVGVSTATQVAATAADYAKIVELQGIVESDDATENSLGYVLHPKLKAALKTKGKASSSDTFFIDKNELDGYKYKSTSLVPVGSFAGPPIVDVYPLIYGDFAQLYIGQWGAVSFLVNPYSEDLADSVRITVNTHADVQIANPKAFAINSFLTSA